MKRALSTSIAVALFTLGVSALVSAHAACSNASLHGNFGFYRTGKTSVGPLAAVGIISFDGKGNSTATQSISRNGDYSFDLSFSGTYVILPDCTGVGYSDGVEFVRLVVTDEGKGLYMFSESPGNAVYGVGRRM
jgi:hypothetical protein